MLFFDPYLAIHSQCPKKGHSVGERLPEFAWFVNLSNKLTINFVKDSLSVNKVNKMTENYYFV